MRQLIVVEPDYNGWPGDQEGARAHAERAGMLWAKRWIDVQLGDGLEPAHR